MTWILVILIELIIIAVEIVVLIGIFVGWLMEKGKLKGNSMEVVTRFTSCQSCQQFISCAMAGVTECPLLK